MIIVGATCGRPFIFDGLSRMCCRERIYPFRYNLGANFLPCHCSAGILSYSPKKVRKEWRIGDTPMYPGASDSSFPLATRRIVACYDVRICGLFFRRERIYPFRFAFLASREGQRGGGICAAWINPCPTIGFSHWCL